MKKTKRLHLILNILREGRLVHQLLDVEEVDGVQLVLVKHLKLNLPSTFKAQVKVLVPHRLVRLGFEAGLGLLLGVNLDHAPGIKLLVCRAQF